MSATINEATLPEIRAVLAPLLAGHAAFDGWNGHALTAAAEEAGVDGDIAALAIEPKPMDLIDAWIEGADVDMARRLPADTLATMKIRERITALVEARLAYAAPHREALRRAMAIMAMPQNALRTAKISWRSADAMWRLAGDTAVDFNHYSKRMTLGAVYGSTLLTLVNDEGADYAETRAFLARRIDNVMAFEKAKFQWKARTEHRPSLARFIGRLRYPA